jgi:hypothetical protein
MESKTPTAVETTAGASSLAGGAIVSSFAEIVRVAGVEPRDQQTADVIKMAGDYLDACGVVFRIADGIIISRVTNARGPAHGKKGVRHAPLPSVDATRLIGHFPTRVNTARADVLMRLLLGKRLTPKDAHREASTMRVSAHVHTIIHDWGWPVQAPLEAVGCRDGRVTEVCRYRLSDECREAALAAGGREWCDAVLEARARRRREAKQAQAKARRINATRAKRKQEVQHGR